MKTLSPIRRLSSRAVEVAARLSSGCHSKALRVVAGAALLALGGGADGATLGGETHAVLGEAKVVFRRAGRTPAEIPLNVRLVFDEEPAATEGDALFRAFDSIGQSEIDSFPFTWTTGKGRAFRAELLGEEFASFLEARLVEAGVPSPEVTVVLASGKGNLSKDGTRLRLAVKVKGEVSIDGAAAVPFNAKAKLASED
jgi:hypothetical protein